MLDVKESLSECPALEGYPAHLVDHHSFEVIVDKRQSLNDLFRMLSAQGIEIVSMRNKANRLEELFLAMVADSGTERESTKS